MTVVPIYNQRFDMQHCCVIVPTYNNAKTLERVLQGILAYTDRLIVINDGATDTTKQILDRYKKRCTILTLSKNKGKGVALRKGFHKAIELGFEYAITIDSDGQHYPSDIPLFIEALENHSSNKELLLIGSRKMDDPSVPGKSSFGNKFSNFWFYVETGNKLTDTQSGFRLYPLKAINKLRLYTTKFELEIEVIVKLAWRGVEVKNLPIRVLYDAKERVSHFRPFQDFSRISLLNTWLFTLTILWYGPKRMFQRFEKKGVSRFIQEDLLKNTDSPFKKSAAIALGIFIGIAPFWGFQTLLVMAMATLLKLNRTIAFICSNISVPPMIPFIVYASVQLGLLATGRPMDLTLNIDRIGTTSDVVQGFTQYILGSFILATLSSFLLGGLSYLYFSITKSKQKPRDA
ncbi:DUF2062 domain-containing protein [Aquimarina sp. W85]|uniref:DUF2062 domain-containing protein n=1 Tax=Aquimarina rhodophyticola TaxID=3342246 RepID=UPI003672092F